MKLFCATKIHIYLHHLDLLSNITIESPYKTTEISGKNRWKEEKRRQKRLPCKLKKGLYEILLVGTCRHSPV